MEDEQVEMVAQIAYRFSFAARSGAGDWERVHQAAEAGGMFAQGILDRCYGMALAIQKALNQ